MKLKIAFSPIDIRILDIKPSEESPLNQFVSRVVEMTRIGCGMAFHDNLEKALEVLKLPQKEYFHLKITLLTGSWRCALADIQKCFLKQDFVFPAEKLKPHAKKAEIEVKDEVKSEQESKSKPKTNASQSIISINETLKNLQWYDQKKMAIGKVGGQSGYSKTTYLKIKLLAICGEDFPVSVGYKTNSQFFTVYFKEKSGTFYPQLKAKLEKYCGVTYSDRLDREYKHAANEPRKAFTPIAINTRFSELLEHWNSEDKKATAKLYGAGMKGIKQNIRAHLRKILGEELFAKIDVKADPKEDEFYIVGLEDCSSESFDKVKQALKMVVEGKSVKRNREDKLPDRCAKKAKTSTYDDFTSSDEEEEEDHDEQEDKQMKDAFAFSDRDWSPSLFGQAKVNESSKKSVHKSNGYYKR